jgi:3-methylcrotonyl-CoA carboxylase alpha subunit
MKTFRKILVANRGEIAVRILKTLNHLAIPSVVIYSKEEIKSLAVEMAGEAYLLEGNGLKDTYLNIEQIIKIAQKSEVDAIHPGYGFLSENIYFARACEEAEIIFIGPAPDSMQLLSDKISSHKFASDHGIPVLKSAYGSKHDLIRKAKEELRLPILIKPSGGGGGKGMRAIYTLDNINEEIEACSREADNYFGNPSVFLEEYLPKAKHIEVQVLGDGKGNAIHLFERECSIQRRFQKIIEEAPSPSIDDDKREELTALAIKLVSSAKYRNAGTVEFLMDEKKNFFFLEMNTRIQVEHPVTEAVTGIDIIEEQIWIAKNGTLRLSQKDIVLKGNAVELRVYAEDPRKGFLPSSGEIQFYKEPMAAGLRVDKSFHSEARVLFQYDPLIAKLIMLGKSRNDAIDKLAPLLQEFIILGISTNLDYLSALLGHPRFIDGSFRTNFTEVESEYLYEKLNSNRIAVPLEILAAIWVYAKSNNRLSDINSHKYGTKWPVTGYWRSVPFYEFICENQYFRFLSQASKDEINIWNASGKLTISIHSVSENLNLRFNGLEYSCWFSVGLNGVVYIEINGWKTEIYPSYHQIGSSLIIEDDGLAGRESEIILAPMHGKIINLSVPKMKDVKKGEVLMVLESMKMENNIIASRDGVVQNFFVETGEQVERDTPLLILTAYKSGDD